MTRNYYYLVSGLPDIVLDSDKPLDAATLRQEIVEGLHPEDQPLVQSVLLHFDNRNLMRVIGNKKEEFDPRGNYPLEELESAIRDPDPFPAYMQAFIESYKESRVLFPDTSLEDTLNRLYYEEMIGSDNAFIREWFEFEMDLRNVVTGLNLRRTSSEGSTMLRDALAPRIVGRNDTAESILRSTTPDFSLGSMLSWVDRVISISFDNLLERERRIDELRWEMLDEMTVFSYFGVERVVAFVVKMTIADRWRSLDASAGAAKLESLVSGLAAGYKPSAEF